MQLHDSKLPKPTAARSEMLVGNTNSTKMSSWSGRRRFGADQLDKNVELVGAPAIWRGPTRQKCRVGRGAGDLAGDQAFAHLPFSRTVAATRPRRRSHPME